MTWNKVKLHSVGFLLPVNAGEDELRPHLQYFNNFSSLFICILFQICYTENVIGTTFNSVGLFSSSMKESLYENIH